VVPPRSRYLKRDCLVYTQYAAPCWIGGQGADPYLQNTQQSRRFGFNFAPPAGTKLICALKIK
jgi:hypothetical protein